ncbi:MAG: hypothetical protein ACJ8GN_12390, partial [Longimicrobiaceae bacterium]
MPRTVPTLAAALALLAAPLAAQGRAQERLALDVQKLASDAQRLASGRDALARSRDALGYDARRRLADAPPPPAFPQDPADALYRQGREALNDEDWLTAARR